MASNHRSQFSSINRPAPSNLQVPNDTWTPSQYAGGRIDLGADFNMLFTPNPQSFPQTPQQESPFVGSNTSPTAQWHSYPGQNNRRGWTAQEVREWARLAANNADLMRVQRFSGQIEDLTYIRHERGQTKYQPIEMKEPQLPSSTSPKPTQELIKKPAKILRHKRATKKAGPSIVLLTLRLIAFLEERANREGEG